MPVIQPYDDHILAQGQLNVRANPNDFGAQVGEGMQHTGAGLQAAGDTMNSIVKTQEALYASNTAQHNSKLLKDYFTDQVNTLDPTDPEFGAKVGNLAKDFDKEIQKSTDSLMQQAPSRFAARQIQAHMNAYGGVLANHARVEQARLVGEYTADQVNTGAKLDVDSVAADPSNENLAATRDSRISSISSLDVSPDLKLKWIGITKHNISKVQVSVLAATKSDWFLKEVGAQGGRTTIYGAVKGAVPGAVGVADAAPDAPVDTTPAPTSFADQWNRLTKQESGGKQFKAGQPLTSKAGAIGISQMLPSTGPEAAKMAGVAWDERRFYQDTTYNEKLGQAYFQKQLDNFGGDFSKAAAAYNAGPHRINSLQAKYGEDWLAHAPKETQGYVAAVTAGFAASTQSGGAAPAEAKSSLVAEQADVPQVQPLNDTEIAQAKPNIAGWAELTWPEKVAAVRQAEAVVGGQLATDRAALTKEVKDIEATHMAGQEYPNLNSPRYSKDNLTRVFGPVEGPRAYDQVVYTQQVGAAMKNISAMPAGQVAALVQSLAPVGGPEFADKNPTFNHLVTAVRQRQTMMDKDWIQYAQDNKVGGVQPVDFNTPEGFQKSINARIPLAISGGRDYGTDAPHALSKDEAAHLGDMLTRLTPQDQIQYLAALRKGTANHDEWYQDVLTQVAPKNTALATAGRMAVRVGSVQTATGQQDGTMVAKFVLEGEHILKGKTLDDETNSGRPQRFNEKLLLVNFWDVVGPNAFASPDGQRSAQIQNDTYQAVRNYLAADSTHKGKTFEEASMDRATVENAVNAVTGGVTKVGGSHLFRPWGMSEGAFNSQFQGAVKTAIDVAGLKGSSLDAPDGFKYINVDEGRYVVTNNAGQVLYGKHGAVTVDMSGMPHTVPGWTAGQAGPYSPTDPYGATGGRAGSAPVNPYSDRRR